jgi:hypothetical protein
MSEVRGGPIRFIFRKLANIEQRIKNSGEQF